MDDARFDLLTRNLAQGLTRRGVAAGFAGVLPGVLPGVARPRPDVSALPTESKP